MTKNLLFFFKIRLENSSSLAKISPTKHHQYNYKIKMTRHWTYNYGKKMYLKLYLSKIFNSIHYNGLKNWNNLWKKN